MIPGEVIPAEGTIETLPGAPRIELEVTNTGDRPVQVGSHFHFAQTNPPCASTARPRTGTGWTSPPAPPSASSPASPAR